MQETTEHKQEPIRIEKFGPAGFMHEMLHGIGVMFGLALLWVLESVRNVFFRMLDRWNIKPRARTRRVSAFPPGSPRKRSAG